LRTFVDYSVKTWIINSSRAPIHRDLVYLVYSFLANFRGAYLRLYWHCTNLLVQYTHSDQEKNK